MTRVIFNKNYKDMQAFDETVQETQDFRIMDITEHNDLEKGNNMINMIKKDDSKTYANIGYFKR